MKLRTAVLFLAVSFVIVNVSIKVLSSIQFSLEDQTKDDTAMVKKVVKSDKEWKEILSSKQYRILRKAGTERPFSGQFNLHFKSGLYTCAACGNPLFDSEAKYDDSCGWPSFSTAVDNGSVDLFDDFSFGMQRVEVRCAACGSHLGHVFDDGPTASRTHFCINSVALDFQPAGSEDHSKAQNRNSSTHEKQSSRQEIATFAAGCFWSVEHTFRKTGGVLSTRVGYMGGNIKNPTYSLICSGKTGHAESVEITFDPTIISYKQLLDHFFDLHDPTQVNRQGLDIGTQYRSVIFFHSGEQKDTAEKYIKELKDSKRFRRPVATKISPAGQFFEAEGYHQQYYEKKKPSAEDAGFLDQRQLLEEENRLI